MDNKWKLFCQFVQLHKTDREETVQRAFEDVFADSALFGYSKALREVEAHRTLHIGSSDRAIPDIVIRDAASNKDLFLVELKQFTLFRSAAFEEQLISYMRLLSLNVGILICDAVYVYYLEGDKAISHKISVTVDNEEGKQFLELFVKGAFNADRIKAFVSEKNERSENMKKIKEELERLDVSYLVKLYFSDRYEEDDIDEALNDYIISVRKKVVVVPEPPTDGGNDGNEGGGTQRPSSGETIQHWVRAIFDYLFRHKVLSEEELLLLHDREYSKRTFKLTYALLVDNQQNTIFSGCARYWQKSIGGYYICSQWELQKDAEYEARIRRWLDKVCPDYRERGLDRR